MDKDNFYYTKEYLRVADIQAMIASTENYVDAIKKHLKNRDFAMAGYLAGRARTELELIEDGIGKANDARDKYRKSWVAVDGSRTEGC